MFYGEKEKNISKGSLDQNEKNRETRIVENLS